MKNQALPLLLVTLAAGATLGGMFVALHHDERAPTDSPTEPAVEAAPRGNGQDPTLTRARVPVTPLSIADDGDGSRGPEEPATSPPAPAATQPVTFPEDALAPVAENLVYLREKLGLEDAQVQGLRQIFADKRVRDERVALRREAGEYEPYVVQQEATDGELFFREVNALLDDDQAATYWKLLEAQRGKVERDPTED